ncbi:hypothetical protein JCM10207_001279 [Rhodosporidiobolus poonsookiae]
MAPSPDLSQLYYALATVRLVLPAVLVALVAVKWISRAFLGLMGRIQAQGWTDDEDLYGPPERVPGADAAKKNGDAGVNGGEGEGDDVTPVVVKKKEQRTTVVLIFFGIAAASFFADGAAQVIATLISSTFTPSLPLWRNIIPYSAGGLAAYCLAGLGMVYEAKLNAKEGGQWGRMFPRVLVLVGLAGDAAVMGLLAKIVAADPDVDPRISKLPVVHLSILAFRLLVLVLLTLFQLPLLYRSAYAANPELAGERTSLLGGRAPAGYSAIPSSSGAEPSPLRATTAPPKRPEDPKSLSILTLFTRVKVLFPYLWPSKSVALQAVALFCFAIMLVKRYVNVIVPIFFGRIISDLSAGRPPYVNIAIYVVVSFLQDSSDMLYRYAWLPIEQYSEREMAMLAFDQLMGLSLAYHTRRKTGELLRILSRSEAINDFFEVLLFSFVPIIIDLPVAFAVLWTRYGFSIVAVVTVVSVVYVATSITLAQSRTKMYRQLRDQSQYMHQIKTDTLFNWDTCKIFTAEGFEGTRLRNAMRRYQKGYFAVYSAWNSLSLLQNSISGFGLLVCSFILAHRVVVGEMDIGNYATFISYLNQLYRPLNSISSTYRQVMSSLVDTEQLMDLLNEEKDVVDRPNAVELKLSPDEGADISFENVRFSYDNKVDVLKGINFTVPKGKSVALVGPSGGGKSTIMRLLYRFYDVKSGSIQLNGHDLRDLTQISIRKNIGLVPQDPVLFNESVRLNIAYGGVGRLDENGKGNLTMEDVIEAAKSAAMHDRIMSFPEQYETRVGERGMRLSGGEKQRVAIARTLLKNPPILLLDEATSALDTHNERLIQKRLQELSQGRTSLIIAHRLSTVVDCDIIHVLKDGYIVESGSHQELLAKEDGVYAELWQKQIEGQESVAPSAAASSSATPVGSIPASRSTTPAVPGTPARPETPAEAGPASLQTDAAAHAAREEPVRPAAQEPVGVKTPYCFDFVFLQAEAEQDEVYLRKVCALLRPGGLLAQLVFPYMPQPPSGAGEGTDPAADAAWEARLADSTLPMDFNEPRMADLERMYTSAGLASASLTFSPIDMAMGMPEYIRFAELVGFAFPPILQECNDHVEAEWVRAGKEGPAQSEWEGRVLTGRKAA